MLVIAVPLPLVSDRSARRGWVRRTRQWWVPLAQAPMRSRSPAVCVQAAPHARPT